MLTYHPLGPSSLQFYDEEKGDALHAMEMALALEKLNFQKLQALAKVADEHGDNQMCDFIEGELLAEQAEAVNTVRRTAADACLGERVSLCKERALRPLRVAGAHTLTVSFVLTPPVCAYAPQVSKYVSQLRRVGKGLGVYQFDKELQ